jgi:hypothetical protein
MNFIVNLFNLLHLNVMMPSNSNTQPSSYPQNPYNTYQLKKISYEGLYSERHWANRKTCSVIHLNNYID